MFCMVRPDHQETCELALRTGRGLKRNAIHTRDLGKTGAQLIDQLKRALTEIFRLERMNL